MVYLVLVLYLIGFVFNLYILYNEFDEIVASDLLISVFAFIPGIIVLLLKLNDPVIYKRKNK